MAAVYRDGQHPSGALFLKLVRKGCQARAYAGLKVHTHDVACDGNSAVVADVGEWTEAHDLRRQDAVMGERRVVGAARGYGVASRVDAIPRAPKSAPLANNFMRALCMNCR